MARQEGQKAKILVLKNILERKTDEEHTLSVPQILEALEREGIKATALIFVGDFLTETPERSKLYDPAFTTGFQTAKGDPES